MDLLDQELRRLGLGRAISAEWLRTGVSWQTDPLVSAHPIGGYHHMGTTRMSDNPRDGVTDAQWYRCTAWTTSTSPAVRFFRLPDGPIRR